MATEPITTDQTSVNVGLKFKDGTSHSIDLTKTTPESLDFIGQNAAPGQSTKVLFGDGTLHSVEWGKINKDSAPFLHSKLPHDPTAWQKAVALAPAIEMHISRPDTIAKRAMQIGYEAEYATDKLKRTVYGALSGMIHMGSTFGDIRSLPMPGAIGPIQMGDRSAPKTFKQLKDNANKASAGLRKDMNIKGRPGVYEWLGDVATTVPAYMAGDAFVKGVPWLAETALEKPLGFAMGGVLARYAKTQDIREATHPTSILQDLAFGAVPVVHDFIKAKIQIPRMDLSTGGGIVPSGAESMLDRAGDAPPVPPVKNLAELHTAMMDEVGMSKPDTGTIVKGPGKQLDANLNAAVSDLTGTVPDANIGTPVEKQLELKLRQGPIIVTPEIQQQAFDAVHEVAHTILNEGKDLTHLAPDELNAIAHPAMIHENLVHKAGDMTGAEIDAAKNASKGLSGTGQGVPDLKFGLFDERGFIRNPFKSEDSRLNMGDIVDTGAKAADIVAQKVEKDRIPTASPFDRYIHSVEAIRSASPDYMRSENVAGLDIPETYKGGGFKDDVLKLFSPGNRGQNALTMVRILRPAMAELTHNKVKAVFQLNNARLAMAKSPEAAFKYVDLIERGDTQAAADYATKNLTGWRGKTLDWKKNADLMKSLNTAAQQAVEGVKPESQHIWRDNYWPHAWLLKNQTDKQAFSKVFGKMPLSGPRGFLKARTIDLISTGRAAGLKLVSDNPVDLWLLKLHEMHRFAMGQTVLQDMKDSGIALHFPNEKEVPFGWTPIDRKIGATTGGFWYAPDEAAQILNNHLSPGLHGSNIYDAIRWSSNLMNMADLSLSGFHFLGTSLNAGISKASLGVMKVFTPGMQMEGLKDIAKGLLVPWAAGENLIKGHEFNKEYINPGTSSWKSMADMVVNLKKAGGSGRMDAAFTNGYLKSFMDAYHAQGVGKLAMSYRFLPALIEATGIPTMQEWVPRMKLGTFYDMADYELRRLGPKATDAEKIDALGAAWDSVDNRYGLLRYDDLFWNNTLKDLSFILIRSVGWNLGTFREFGGAAVDLARSGVGALKGEGFKVTQRMAYTATIPVMTAFYGTVYTYLRTGHAPQKAINYFLWQTGEHRPDGTEILTKPPIYTSDMISYLKHPITTFENKLNPQISAMWQVWHNKDYYGDQIYNPNDHLYQKGLEFFKFAAQQYEPFAIRNLQNIRANGQSWGKAAESFAGLTPASRTMTFTPAEEKMSDYIFARDTQGGRPIDTTGRREVIRTIQNAMAKGDNRLAQSLLTKAANNGLIGQADKEYFNPKRIGGGYLKRSIWRLSLDQALDVYGSASEREKGEIFWDVFMKFKSVEKKAPVEQNKYMPFVNQMLEDGYRLRLMQRPAGRP